MDAKRAQRYADGRNRLAGRAVQRFAEQEGVCVGHEADRALRQNLVEPRNDRNAANGLELVRHHAESPRIVIGAGRRYGNAGDIQPQSLRGVQRMAAQSQIRAVYDSRVVVGMGVDTGLCSGDWPALLIQQHILEERSARVNGKDTVGHGSILLYIQVNRLWSELSKTNQSLNLAAAVAAYFLSIVLWMTIGPLLRLTMR